MANKNGWVVHCRRAPYDVYVGRPSKWGNPYQIGPDGNREQVIAKFRAYLEKNVVLKAQCKRELKGKILSCWCHPQACHADVLAEVANG